MADWQRKPEHGDWLRALFADDRFRDFFAVVNNEMPIPATGDQFQAGITRGYAYCIQVMLKMIDKQPELPQEPEMTYGTDDTET